MKSACIWPRGVVLFSSVNIDYVNLAVEKYHIDYLMLRPCELEAVASRARDLASAAKPGEPRPDPRVAVTDALLRLNVSPRHKGFPLDPSGDVARPTSAGFIAHLSAALQIGRL